MISSKKAITVTADKTAKTEFINKASAPDKGKITIHKRDAETRADLAGAKFEVAAARISTLATAIVSTRKEQLLTP